MKSTRRPRLIASAPVIKRAKLRHFFFRNFLFFIKLILDPGRTHSLFCVYVCVCVTIYACACICVCFCLSVCATCDECVFARKKKDHLVTNYLSPYGASGPQDHATSSKKEKKKAEYIYVILYQILLLGARDLVTSANITWHVPCALKFYQVG